MYRTLIVAPKTDLLLVDDEVQAAVNLINARLIQGSSATMPGLQEMVQRGWDILWFATHGDETGILLSDGKLTTSALTTMVRTAGASLVVLNTCSSLDVAFGIHNELLTDVICTIRPIPDRDAFLTGKTFAFHLSKGLTPLQAYLAAKPGGNRNYLYLMGDRGDMSQRPHADNRSTRIQAGDETVDVEGELRRLIMLIDGDDRWAQTGIMKTLTNLSDKMEKLESSIRVIRIIMWMIAATTFLVLIAVVLLSMNLMG